MNKSSKYRILIYIMFPLYFCRASDWIIHKLNGNNFLMSENKHWFPPFHQIVIYPCADHRVPHTCSSFININYTVAFSSQFSTSKQINCNPEENQGEGGVYSRKRFLSREQKDKNRTCAQQKTESKSSDSVGKSKGNCCDPPNISIWICVRASPHKPCAPFSVLVKLFQNLQDYAAPSSCNFLCSFAQTKMCG